MATGMMARTDEQHEIITQPNSVGAMAEVQRTTAEIQAALTIAASRPRDEVRAVERLMTSCQRQGLAERAQYVYSRGGTDITGPTIDLLTVIANCWGNIQFGFRVLAQRNGVSEIEAFAWDLETNSKRAVVFTVPHVRSTKKGNYKLTDPRDIYELEANMAQRRVRSCLEAIVPPDVVEDALQECLRTLQTKADITPEAVKKLIEAFQTIGITKEQIEQRLGRKLESMQPAQLVKMRQIFKSIKDGMSTPAEWFEQGETDSKAKDEPKSTVDAAKDALRKKTQPAATVSSDPVDFETALTAALAACSASEDVAKVANQFDSLATTDDQKQLVNKLSDEAFKRVKKGK